MTGNDSYVPLHRRFRDASKDVLSGWARRLSNRSNLLDWDKLVPVTPDSGEPERSALVILSPSQAGKTTELQERCSQLRNSGVDAFFLRAIDVALRTTYISPPADAARFDAWRKTSARGVFFLDAIDEAQIEGHDVEGVLLRFAGDIDAGTRRLQLVVSSRNDVWLTKYGTYLARALALPPESLPIRVVSLEPLGRDDVHAYAKASNVKDDAAFIQAFTDDELDMLLEHLRPPDVRLLVEYWKQHGRFGSWSDMLSRAVDSSVRDENRKHAHHQQFSLEEAHVGVRRLAAATLLGKRRLISLPGNRHADEVDAEGLFRDWQPQRTFQLLAMGLFAQKGMTSVQLPPGPPTDFLAAKWLIDRSQNGLDYAALEAILLTRPFGVSQVYVPASRFAALGWVAGGVPELRRVLLDELPHGSPQLERTRGYSLAPLTSARSGPTTPRTAPAPTRRFPERPRRADDVPC